MALQPHIFVASLEREAYNLIKKALDEEKFKCSALNSLRTVKKQSDIMKALKAFVTSGYKTSALAKEAALLKAAKEVSTVIKTMLTAEN